MKIELKNELLMLFFPSCLQYKDLHIFHVTNENNMNQSFCIDIDQYNQNLNFIYF